MMIVVYAYATTAHRDLSSLSVSMVPARAGTEGVSLVQKPAAPPSAPKTPAPQAAVRHHAPAPTGRMATERLVSVAALLRRAALAGFLGAGLAVTALLMVLCGVVPVLLDPSARADTPASMPGLVVAIVVSMGLAALMFGADAWYSWRARREPVVATRHETPATSPLYVSREEEHTHYFWPPPSGQPGRHTHLCDCGTIIFCPRALCAYSTDYRCATCEFDARDQHIDEKDGQ